jgi:hypothetical protein
MRKRHHALSGAMYEVGEDGFVHVDLDGTTGVFDHHGRWVSGDLTHADPHMCLWLAGPQLPDGMSVSHRDIPNSARS